MLWISQALISAFYVPSVLVIRGITQAFNDASNAIRVELELNGGEEITLEAR